MREKLVKRYYCSFCSKGMFFKNRMIEHEKHCTMNPERVCRIHAKLIEGGDCQHQPKIKHMIHGLERYLAVEFPVAVSPIRAFRGGSDSPYCDYGINFDKGFEFLKKLASGCPVCILATIRQARLKYPRLFIEYDFKHEMESTLSELWSLEERYE